MFFIPPISIRTKKYRNDSSTQEKTSTPYRWVCNKKYFGLFCLFVCSFGGRWRSQEDTQNSTYISLVDKMFIRKYTFLHSLTYFTDRIGRWDLIPECLAQTHSWKFGKNKRSDDEATVTYGFRYVHFKDRPNAHSITNSTFLKWQSWAVNYHATPVTMTTSKRSVWTHRKLANGDKSASTPSTDILS